MKVELKREEEYSVAVIKRIEVEVPEGTEDVKAYLKEYLDTDEAEDAFGDADPEERWSDMTEIYHEAEINDGEDYFEL
jgi:hypothetical protein